MQALGQAKPAPTTEELIALLSKAITNVMQDELSDANDPDRIWILRRIHKNYLYYRNLQYFAPSLYQGLLDVSGVTISGTGVDSDNTYGFYDYSQNIYRGYCRKMEAVLGNRMPNAIAVPDNPDDEEAIRSTRSANNAALYIRQKCELQLQSLYLVFSLFNFGTSFWHLEMVEDALKYGTKPQPIIEQQQKPLGNAAFQCPNCAESHPVEDSENPPDSMDCSQCGQSMDQTAYQPPTMGDVPVQTEVKQIPKKGIEISLHAADEVTVPLDATCIDTCMWLRYDREKHKALLLSKWRKQLGDRADDNEEGKDYNTQSEQYAEQVRSAFGSPIGLIRTGKANQWTQSDTWWRPEMYEMLRKPEERQMLRENFPRGLRFTSVKGKIVDMVEEFLPDMWQEVKPEPAKRIMADPLGDDWTETQDIHTNTLNQANEIIERNNQAGFYDPTRIDGDALQNRRSLPGEMIPALRPAGGSLADIVYQPEALQFSEQIPAFRQQVEDTAKNIGGLGDAVWGGGDAEEPTARQAELKKNASLQQLGVTWSMIGNALEKLNKKACKLLADFEDGVIAFSKKNQFGQFDTMSVIVDDLKSGKYHFEADEAIPMTWGQQRDLLMWMLDKPAPLLQQWGMDDPLNIFEFKQLLGMPGERTPGLDQREKCMNVIAQLLTQQPQPGPIDPQTQQPGPQQASIQPDWEDDHDFCSRLSKAYLVVNSHLAKDNAPGYQNVQLWGQAQFTMANQPPPPAPPKTSVAVSLKGDDIGPQGVQDLMQKEGLLNQGTPVQPILKQGQLPPPGAAMQPPNAPPTTQPGAAATPPIQ